MATVLPRPAQMLMMLLASALATLTSPGAVAGFNAPYVGSYTYSGKLADCVNGGKRALEKHGFSVDEVKYVNNNKAAFLYARHNDLALGATIECDPSRGIGSWGVAGPNDRDAFEYFQRLGREAW